MEPKINISCDTARDLLPLYVDDILSVDSRALVEDHLPQCPPCADELKALRSPAGQPKFSASKGLMQSKQRLRRLIAVIASITAVAVAVVCFFGFRIMQPERWGPGVTIPFEENPINLDALYRYTATRGDTGSEAEFLWIENNRLPRFEWAGVGQASAEDVITMDGQRVGVAFVQLFQAEDQKQYALRRYEKDGRNESIVGMGGMGLLLSPMPEAEKADILAYRQARMADPLSADDPLWLESAGFARDLPITRVYYYNGPGENLKNDPLGWSEREGILADCVLIWDTETTPQGRTPPPYVYHGRTPTTPDGEMAPTMMYTMPVTAENE